MSFERKSEYYTVKLELDEATTFSDYKKNRINGQIKSIRVGRVSNSKISLKLKLKEGDEINLWPGRIINLSEISMGAFFSWPAQVNEWVEIEISENQNFVGGDNVTGSSGVSSGVASDFRRSEFRPTKTTRVQILAKNGNRLKAIIYNDSDRPILIGSYDNLNTALATSERLKTCTRIAAFDSREFSITGEVWTVGDNSFNTSNYPYIVRVEEFLA